MNREQVMEWGREAGMDCTRATVLCCARELERFAALVAAAERRKHQVDIEVWKAEAVTAEKWRGMALAKDPMQPGKAVQVIQQEASAAEREACADAVQSVVGDLGRIGVSTAQIYGASMALEAIRARGQEAA